jgi:hypothetical protein
MLSALNSTPIFTPWSIVSQQRDAKPSPSSTFKQVNGMRVTSYGTPKTCHRWTPSFVALLRDWEGRVQ